MSLSPILSNISNRNAYQLALSAECSSPDAKDSPGAAFLASVAQAVVEYVDRLSSDEPGQNDLRTLTDWADDDGSISQIADDAPDVYTYTRWLEFTDLAAWQEDPDEGFDGTDMTASAGACLYMIAERLAWSLLAEIQDAANASDDA